VRGRLRKELACHALQNVGRQDLNLSLLILIKCVITRLDPNWHAGTHNNHLLVALIPQSGAKRGQRWFNQVSRELGEDHTVPNRVGKQPQCCI
jgi:hypothetical protein